MSMTPETTPSLSPWFASNVYRPPMPGPYECRMDVSKTEDAKPHMRWWNGSLWSLPLQDQHIVPEYENGDYDRATRTAYKRPNEDWFEPRPNTWPEPFSWRGFNEDQDPL